MPFICFCKLYLQLSLGHYHHHYRLNFGVSMLSTGCTVPLKIWEFVERMFYGRMSLLTPTLPTLEPMPVFILESQHVKIHFQSISTFILVLPNTKYQHSTHMQVDLLRHHLNLLPAFPKLTSPT